MLNIKMGINTIIKKCMLAAHPVGSYYMSSVSTSPAQLFGGTWERVTDKFLWAAGDSEIGTTGGERNHTLTVDEMPRHNHLLYRAFTLQNSSADSYTDYRIALGNSGYNTGHSSSTGGSLSHNNMPPFVGVYCWKRTA